MANKITEKGIEIRSLEEIKDLIINGDDETDGLQKIFGEDAIFESDSPDGQLVGIFAQAVRDLEELILNTYNSFDPDKAIGISLDNRVAYNGVIRKGATYTIIPVRVENTTDKEIKITGLNEFSQYRFPEYVSENYKNVFAVYDNIGNEFLLLNTEILSPHQVATLSFRAREVGQVYVSPNTITRAKMVVVGLSVSNPNEPFIIGENEETDQELRIRRNKAVGYGLLGSVEVLNKSLRQLNDVTDAAVFENNTDSVDTSTEAGGNFPAHSVWIIVEGGDEEQIANTIFLRLNVGCGMKTTADSVEVSVETILGHYQDIYFNRPLYEPIIISMRATPKNSKAYLNPDLFIPEFAKRFNFSIYQPASTTEIDCIANEVQDDYSYYDIVVVLRREASQITATQDINYQDWTSITDGVLKVNINNGLETRTFTGLDFSGASSVTNIKNIIATKISGYGNVSVVSNTIEFVSAITGTNEHYRSFVPIRDDSGSGTDIYSLLGTLQNRWFIDSATQHELVFPDTYQHKFTIRQEDIILTKDVWGD